MTLTGWFAALAAIVLVTALLSPLLAWTFCVRPAPRWMRAWRDVAIALLAARVLLLRLAPGPSDVWLAVAWANLAVWGMVIAWHNWNSAMGRGADRCTEGWGRGPVQNESSVVALTKRTIAQDERGAQQSVRGAKQDIRGAEQDIRGVEQDRHGEELDERERDAADTAR